MNAFVPSCEKARLSPSRRPRRDPDAVRQAMLSTAGVSPIGTNSDSYLLDPRHHEDVGLPLGKLEAQRWGVSPPVARAKLQEAGLPYEGRRAGLIYRWASIFRAEGVIAELAETATRHTHAHLFNDLVDTAEAAALLGYRDASSIRKLVISGQLPVTAYIQFGSRGVYRFRPEQLRALRKRTSVGRIV